MTKPVLCSLFLLAGLAAKAQNDTLLWNNFETDPFSHIQILPPPGTPSDTSWYTFDIDQLPDGSPQGRPGEWFWTAPFSATDSTLGNTGVIGSNSWSNSSTANQNVLITPSLYIGDANAVLSWKSAPYQTPRYLDGYKILVAVGNNDLAAFTDTIFVASEYASLDNSSAPNNFNSYTFAPAPTLNPLAPFVHGKDGTFTEFPASSGDSSRLVGILRPFSLSLAQYNGSTIYIEFLHDATDDNLLSVDDILVMGTDFTSVSELNKGVAFSAYPNPANDELNIRYELPSSSAVTINVYDITGKLWSSESKGTLNGLQTSKIDVSTLPAGMYRVELVTESGRSNKKIVVQ